MQNEIKKMKAITLIALTITIVVLIILAGVAINLSLGENGLFNKAKYGAESYTNGQVHEEKEIAKMTNEIDKNVNSSRDYETEINELKARITELENLNNYSGTEKVIGKWIDGKDIYIKTYSGLNVNIDNKWSVIVNDTTSASVDTLIKVEVIGKDSTSNTNKTNFVPYSKLEGGKISCYARGWNFTIQKAIITYTKN